MLYESHNGTVTVSIIKRQYYMERPQRIGAEVCKTLLAVPNNKFTDSKLCATSLRDTSDSDGLHFNIFGLPIWSHN